MEGMKCDYQLSGSDYGKDGSITKQIRALPWRQKRERMGGRGKRSIGWENIVHMVGIVAVVTLTG